MGSHNLSGAMRHAVTGSYHGSDQPLVPWSVEDLADKALARHPQNNWAFQFLQLLQACQLCQRVFKGFAEADTRINGNLLQRNAGFDTRLDATAEKLEHFRDDIV